jgi:hypothetical protein
MCNAQGGQLKERERRNEIQEECKDFEEFEEDRSDQEPKLDL